MSIYSQLIKHITFPILSPREGLRGVNTYLRKYERSQYWSPQQIAEYQFLKIKKLLYHAYNHSPFYRERISGASFHPDNFQSLADLRKLPPLTKADLQTKLSSLVAKNFKETEIHRDATGGSTGNHTPFYRDNRCLGIKKAIEYRCNQWAGWDLGEKIAYYWPAIQDFGPKETWKGYLKNALIFRSLMLYSGIQNKNILKDHYDQLSAFKPQLVRCFPNPLSVLAKYIKDTNKPKLHIPSIISVGEPLLENQRKLFKEVFGARVYNCYVSRECGNMACECGAEPGNFHVNAEMVFIEPIDDNGKNRPVKFLVTDLTNYGMPLIRYQIEDLGVFINTSCSCGRGLPIVRMEAGRASDFLISPYDKSRVSGCSFLHHLIAEGPQVGQIQVIQDVVNHLTLKIVKSQSFHHDQLAHVDQVIKKIFKGKMLYNIEYVDVIEREKSNKYFFTKCLVAENANGTLD